MKFTTIIAVLAGVVAVSALPATETNAERLARGLPPLPPARRGTAVAGARRAGPSPRPHCHTGSVYCCAVVTNPSNKDAKQILGLLGITLDSNDTVGMKCTPIPVNGNAICSQHALCCAENFQNGVIAIGCNKNIDYTPLFN